MYLTYNKKTNKKCRIVDIAYIKADVNYSTIFLVGGTKNHVARTLKFFQNQLPDSFLRLHRCILINPQQCKVIDDVIFFNNKEIGHVSRRTKTKQNGNNR